MRKKVFVGMVALVSAVGGVAACGSGDKSNGKTPVAQTAAVAGDKVENVQKALELKPAETGVVPGPGISQPRFTLVLSEGKSGFKFRSAALSNEAKAKIDEMFTGDKFDMKNAHFEIEGYTDNLGSGDVNEKVGLARAEAVKQYLGEEYEIPADWISVVSYGMQQPVSQPFEDSRRELADLGLVFRDQNRLRAPKRCR